MKQVIIIHGGTTFSSYEKYIDDLKTKKIMVDRLRSVSTWRENLQSILGRNFDVLMPSMPNKSNAKYTEWEIWFSRIAEVAEDGCILIGHSLGGVFLAKYLSENNFPKKIAATFLVAAPYDDETNEDLTDFKISRVTDLFTNQAGKIVFFNGHDDPVIPISDLDKYKREIPDAEFNILSAPDHFVRPEFPELVDALRHVDS